MRTHVKVLFAAFAVGLLAMPAWAQDSATTLNSAISGYESAAHESFQGLATDWSSHHVVYSKPAPGSDTESTIQQDPRYWAQQIRRSSVADDVQTDSAFQSDSKKAKKKKKKKNTLTGLWSVNLGSGATVGNEMYPATFTAGTSSVSCTNDFAVYNTSLTGSVTVPSIAAFVNIYSSCSGSPPPTTFWAFDTAAGAVVTSPVLSGNGQKVAFVQTVAGVANLVVLTWKSGSGTLGAPTVLASNGSYPTCTAPCMISLPLNGNPADTNSSPFYTSAGTDVIYVGDNAGKLHKFINIFLGGTPSEVTTGGWPVTVGTNALSSPVTDINTHNIFVGDAAGNLRYVRDTGSTVGTCTAGSPPCLGNTTIAQGGKIVDGPLLDVSTQRVTWFNGTIAAGGTTDRVQQTDEALASQGIVNFANNGATGQTTNMHAGTFDDAYFTTPSTGFLYVIARNATHHDHASLFRIGFTGNNMNSLAAAGPLDLVGGSTSIPLAKSAAAPLTLSGATIAANATGTVTVTADPAGSDTLTVGTVLYTFHGTIGACAAPTATTGCILHGGTNTQDAENIEAAINNNAAQCGTTAPCFSVTAANPGASATNPVTAVTTITNELGGGAESSPITEIQTTTTDDFFASVQANGSRTGCAGACLYSFLITSQTFPANSTAGRASTGGTSGIVLDNLFNAGGSQVYYTPLANSACLTGGTGGCATQASQAALN